jgi:photosystem II stability/assembly factor-like uncharacterized protein
MIVPFVRLTALSGGVRPGQGERGVCFSDTVHGAFHAVTTDDRGRHWNVIPADQFPAAMENEGAFAASGQNISVVGEGDAASIWVGLGAHSGGAARVLHRPHAKAAWIAQECPPLRSGPSAGIFSLAFRDRQHGVAVGGDYAQEGAVGVAAVTSDGGQVRKTPHWHRSWANCSPF